MDRTTKTNKWTGRALAAALACMLLAGCGGGQVPNQRVYDRYAALMPMHDFMRQAYNNVLIERAGRGPSRG